MLAKLGTLGIFTCLFLGFEIYTYIGLRSIWKDPSHLRIFNIVYLLQSVFVLWAFYQMYTGLTRGQVFRSTELNWYIGIVFTVFVTKLVFCCLMLLQDGGRIIGYIVDLSRSIFGSKPIAETSVPARRQFLSALAAGIASVPFFSMLYGITKGKYNYKIHEVSLAFEDLPKAFDGFKVVQISDIHSGSLDDPDSVLAGVEMVNACKPDVICFTGDLVNEDKDEVNPFMEIFSQLKANYGKYAVLGNHDYYGQPQEQSKRDAYWKDFYQKFESMGFDLLNNISKPIEKDGEQIIMAGVENWGAGRWFPKIGDLNKALNGVSESMFTLLMSHDPTHWDEKVIPHSKHVHLTMSGHTHGMQFGINMPGFKWSPAQYRYPRWMGLYEDKGQYLYVNRGFGFLAFPGRVGMWPEITVITLKSA